MGQQKPLVALMLSTFLQQLVFSSNFKSIFRDEGDNVTLICPASLEKSANLNWIITDAQAKEEFQNQVLNNVVQDDGSLFLENVSRTDSHLYTCQDAENNQSLGSIKLQICGVPSAVNNFTAITHSVYALGQAHHMFSRFLNLQIFFMNFSFFCFSTRYLEVFY